MGMIQIDMEMPATCYDCPFCHDCCSCCLVENSEFDFEICDEQRMPYCPLKEVPDNAGKWTTERTQEHDGEWYCSECGYEPVVMSDDMKYCPGCGEK